MKTLTTDSDGRFLGSIIFDQPGAFQIRAHFAGGKVKVSYVSPSNVLGHYSTLGFIENLWGMTPLSNGPDYCCGDIGATPLDILQ